MENTETSQPTGEPAEPGADTANPVPGIPAPESPAPGSPSPSGAAEISDTRPNRVGSQKLTPPSRLRRVVNGLIAVLLFLFLLLAVSAVGSYAGYQSVQQVQNRQATEQIVLSLEKQYQLGLEDLEAGRVEVARQRFQYIIDRDPAYPGATDQLARAMQVIYATSTPTPPLPTATPSPTPDLRPVEEQFTNARSLFDSQNWSAAIDALVTLRKIDPSYQVTLVDRLLYASLRNLGVNRILVEGSLESGTYDLALAENFGPLDIEASQARDLARLYVIGLSFWEVHPEQAVYYFGQVASAAPFLHDGTGWSAKERYREALVQYGDLLASRGDWCGAFDQYQLAYSLIPDEALSLKGRQAAEKCAPPTSTPTPTGALLASPTPTLPAAGTPTPTWPAPPLETPTFTFTPPAPVETETPTQPPPPPPTETPPGPPPTDTLEATRPPKPTRISAAPSFSAPAPVFSPLESLGAIWASLLSFLEASK